MRSLIGSRLGLGAFALALIIPTAASAADLEVKAWSATSSATGANFTLTVCNNGTAAVTADIGIFLDQAGTPACGAGAFLGGAFSWAPGCQTFNFPIELPAGTYKWAAFVDSACTVTETNETNNVKNLTVDVLKSTTDLSIKTWTVTATAGVNGSADMTFEVCNGATVPRPFSLSIWMDRATAPTCGATGATYAFDEITLDPNTCVPISATVPRGSDNASQKAWIFIDSKCQVGEKDETNNMKSATYKPCPSAAAIAGTYTGKITGSIPLVGSITLNASITLAQKAGTNFLTVSSGKVTGSLPIVGTVNFVIPAGSGGDLKCGSASFTFSQTTPVAVTATLTGKYNGTNGFGGTWSGTALGLTGNGTWSVTKTP